MIKKEVVEVIEVHETTIEIGIIGLIEVGHDRKSIETAIDKIINKTRLK